MDRKAESSPPFERAHIATIGPPRNAPGSAQQTAYLIGYNLGAVRLWRQYVELGHAAENGVAASLNYLSREVAQLADSLAPPLFAEFQSSIGQLHAENEHDVTEVNCDAKVAWDREWQSLATTVRNCMASLGLLIWSRLGEEVATYYTVLFDLDHKRTIRRPQDLPPLSGIQQAIGHLPSDARAALPSANRLLSIPATSPLELVELAISFKGRLSRDTPFCVTAMFHALDRFRKRLIEELGAVKSASMPAAQEPLDALSSPTPTSGSRESASPLQLPTSVAAEQSASPVSEYCEGYLGLELNSQQLTARRTVNGESRQVDLSSKPIHWTLLKLLSDSGERRVSVGELKSRWRKLGGQGQITKGTIYDAVSELRHAVSDLGIVVNAQRNVGYRLQESRQIP